MPKLASAMRGANVRLRRGSSVDNGGSPPRGPGARGRGQVFGQGQVANRHAALAKDYTVAPGAGPASPVRPLLPTALAAATCFTSRWTINERHRVRWLQKVSQTPLGFCS